MTFSSCICFGNLVLLLVYLFCFQVPLEGSQGDNVTMVVHTSRLPTPTIAWFKDEEPIVSDSHLEIIEEPDHVKLLVKDVTPADSGTYKCIASSILGTITKKFLLNIEGKLYVYENVTSGC